MNTPLLAIRIRHSECAALHAGQQFDTIAQFDATLRAARHVRPNSGRVAFVITWKDGATFHGQYELDRHGEHGLVEHVNGACREALKDPQLRVLLAGASLTVQRLFEAAIAERAAGLTQPCNPREVKWLTQMI